MHFINRVFYKLPPKVVTGNIVDAVHKFFDKESFVCLFDFSDSEIMKRKGINILVKQKQYFLQFVQANNCSSLISSKNILPININDIKEIANGIPKKYPFHKAMFVFPIGYSVNEIIKECETCDNLNVLCRKIKAIVIKSDWWISKRELEFWYQDIIDNKDGNINECDFNPFPIKERKVVTILDEIEVKEMNEMKQYIVNKIFTKYNGISTINYSPSDTPFSSKKGIKPSKNVTILFSKHGFIPNKKKTFIGNITFEKRLESNNIVELSVDYGSWSHLLKVIFCFRNIKFMTVLPNPLIGSSSLTQHIYNCPEDIERILIEYEKTYTQIHRYAIAEIDEFVGTSPRWFT